MSRHSPQCLERRVAGCGEPIPATRRSKHCGECLDIYVQRAYLKPDRKCSRCSTLLSAGRRCSRCPECQYRYYLERAARPGRLCTVCSKPLPEGLKSERCAECVRDYAAGYHVKKADEIRARCRAW